jgi:hypothetical protein
MGDVTRIDCRSGANPELAISFVEFVRGQGSVTGFSASAGERDSPVDERGDEDGKRAGKDRGSGGSMGKETKRGGETVSIGDLREAPQFGRFALAFGGGLGIGFNPDVHFWDHPFFQ